MNKLSIIIPIYNVEKYLPQCLDSVINQTYKNLEIILINDGSSDSCPKICEEYAAKDYRIKVIHKKNGGLSDARNEGLKIASGSFISFLDSDDFLSVDFYKILVRTLIEYDADIVECGFRKFERDLDFVKEIETGKENIELFETEIALKLLMTEYFKQIVWNKIYRKEIVADLQFPVNKINEDEFWTYKVFGNAKKIVKIPNELYFYRQQSDSIMGTKYSLKRLDGLQAMEERINFMRKDFPTLVNLAIEVFCFGSFFHYQKICEHQEIDPQKIYRKKIIKSVKKYNEFSIYKDWDWKAIFWYKLFLFNPKSYIKFRNYNDTRVQKNHKQKDNTLLR